MKKYNKSRHMKRLHAYWSKLVIRMWGNKCGMGNHCLGKNITRYNAHHIYGKGAHPSMRFIPENGICLCFTCHRAVHDDPHHRDGLLRSKIDRQTLEYLHTMSLRQNLMNRVWLDQQEINLKEFEAELNVNEQEKGEQQ